MRELEKIEPDYYYHIYNRGINGTNVFVNDENYLYFLKLYQKYIMPVANTYAWVLLKNHFHFLIKIKSEEELMSFFKIDELKAAKKTSQNFSHFFNSYVQAFNKQQNRHGSLFEKPFKRKRINNENYLKTLILYIHNNPIQHGFAEDLNSYKWSSYKSITSGKETLIERDFVLDLFENKENYIFAHQEKFDAIQIERWLKI